MIPVNNFCRQDDSWTYLALVSIYNLSYFMKFYWPQTKGRNTIKGYKTVMLIYEHLMIFFLSKYSITKRNKLIWCTDFVYMVQIGGGMTLLMGLILDKIVITNPTRKWCWSLCTFVIYLCNSGYVILETSWCFSYQFDICFNSWHVKIITSITILALILLKFYYGEMWCQDSNT